MPTHDELVKMYSKVTVLQKIVTLQHIHTLYLASQQAKPQRKEISFNILQLQKMINNNPLINPDFDFLDMQGSLMKIRERKQHGEAPQNILTPIQIVQVIAETLAVQGPDGKNEQIIAQIPKTTVFTLSAKINVEFVRGRLLKILNSYKNTSLKDISALEMNYKRKQKEVAMIKEGKISDQLLLQEYMKNMQYKMTAQRQLSEDTKKTVAERSAKQAVKASQSKARAEKQEQLKEKPASRGSRSEQKPARDSIARRLRTTAADTAEEEDEEEVEKSEEEEGENDEDDEEEVEVDNEEDEEMPDLPKEAEKVEDPVQATPGEISASISRESVSESVIAEVTSEQIKEIDLKDTKSGTSSPDKSKPSSVEAEVPTSPPKMPRTKAQRAKQTRKAREAKVEAEKVKRAEAEKSRVEAEKAKVGAEKAEAKEEEFGKTKEAEKETEEVDEEAETKEAEEVKESTSRKRKAKSQQLKVDANIERITRSLRSSPARKKRRVEETDEENAQPVKRFKTIVSTLSSNPFSSLFMRPVDAAEDPAYSKLIKQPVDLETLSKSIDAGEVRSVQELEFQLQLMFTNAVMYNNMSDTKMYDGILSMMKDSEKLLQEIHNSTEAKN